MKLFICKLGIFLIPVAVFLGPAFLYLRGAGEILDFDEIIRRNQKESALIGMAYSNPIHSLKSQIVVRKTPEIIALGTSRTMQVRGGFFRSDAGFYNCGGSIHKIGDLSPFLESLKSRDPQIIIVGLDQNFFNEDWDDLRGTTINYKVGTSLLQTFSIASRDFYKDVLRSDLDLNNLSVTMMNEVGVTANIHSEGYRSDGSYRYRKSLKEGASFQPAVDLVRAGGRDGRYSQGSGINTKAIEELEIFLKLCKERGIHVVAFLPPYANVVYQEIKKLGVHYQHIVKLQEELEPLFEGLGYRVFDFSDNSAFGSSDLEMQDSIHGYEIALLRILLTMAREDPLLSNYMDTAGLSDVLKESKDPGDLFGEDN